VAAKIFEELVRERFSNCLLAFDFLMQKDERILTEDKRKEKRKKKERQETKHVRQKKTSEFF